MCFMVPEAAYIFKTSAKISPGSQTHPELITQKSSRC
jgi:hypothetical protein